MRDTIVSSVARGLLQALAGYLIARGWLSAEDAELLVGALVVLIGLAWSILARRNAARLTEAKVEAARAEVPAEVVPALNRAAEAAEKVQEVASTVSDLAGRLGSVLPKGIR